MNRKKQVQIISAIAVATMLTIPQIFIGFLFGQSGAMPYILIILVGALVGAGLSFPKGINGFTSLRNKFETFLAVLLFLWIVFFVTTILMIQYEFFPIFRNVSYQGLLPRFLFIFGISVPGIVLILNLIIYLTSKSKYKKSRINSILQELINQREQSDKFGATSRQLNALIMLCYLTILFVVVALIAFFIGVIAMTSLLGIRIMVIVAAVFIQACIIYPFLPKGVDSKKAEYILAPCNYPVLYNATSFAAKLLGVKKRFDIYLTLDANVGIVQEKKKYAIFVGRDILRALNESEIKAVMLHEFAHAAHGDLKLNRRIAKLSSLIERKNIIFLLLGQQFGKVVSKTERFLLVKSKNCEEAADNAVLKYDIGQDFINATAKMTMLEYHADSLPIYNVFEDENAPENYSSVYFDNFLKSYRQKTDAWKYMCKVELPWRFGTHPVCSERMTNLGVLNFMIDFENQSESLLKEWDLACAHSDLLIGYEKHEWEDARRQNYSKHLSIIENFEKESQLCAADTTELKTIADSYFELCRYDECLEILGIILADNPNDGFALYKKGIILCTYFSDEGLDSLQKVAEKDIQYLENAALTMFKYIARRGMAERRDQLRKWADAKMEEVYSFQKDRDFKKKLDVERHDLSDITIDKIKKLLIENGILSCRIVKKFILEQAVYYIYVEPKLYYSADGYSQTMQNISNQLDGFEETFFLADYRIGDKLYKKSKKIKDNLIYKTENSAYSTRMSKYSLATRRRRRLDAFKIYRAIMIVLAALSPFLAFGGVLISQLVPTILWVLVMLSGFFAFLTAMFMSLYNKDRRFFYKNKFIRPRFYVEAENADKAKNELEEFLQDMGFKPADDYRNHQRDTLLCGLLHNGYKSKIYGYFKITSTDNIVELEAYLLVHKADKGNENETGASDKSYEAGIYGVSNGKAKAIMKQFVINALNILNAPQYVCV